MSNMLSISEAAEYLGISEQTLRRWDNDGTFRASLVSSGGHRYYSLADLERMTKGLFQSAKDWAGAESAAEPAGEFYCATSERFKTRLERMALEFTKTPHQDAGSIVTAIAGEIGNNSFDHNLGNWPDVPGVFFAYDFGKRVVVLADRGRGVLTTLRDVRPSLADDQEALQVAFTEVLTGRAPEHRGNGLKFVREAVAWFGPRRLKFQSGAAVVEIGRGGGFSVSSADPKVHGCLALIDF
jgi:excisionase family DNA binding protein